MYQLDYFSPQRQPRPIWCSKSLGKTISLSSWIAPAMPKSPKTTISNINPNVASRRLVLFETAAIVLQNAAVPSSFRTAHCGPRPA